MTVFLTAFLICGSAIVGWNKKLQESTKMGWYIFTAVLIVIYVLKHIF